MPNYPSRPASPRLNRAHPLAPFVRAFWSPRPAGPATLDDLSGQGRVGTPGGGLNVGTSPFSGPAVAFNTGYYDIASGPSRPLLTAGVPFTLSWWENLTVSLTSALYSRLWLSVASAPGNGFVCGRSDISSVKNLFFGGAQSGGNGYAASDTGASPGLDSASSVGIWRHWAIVGKAGPASATATDYAAYCDGRALTIVTAAFGGLTAVTNRIGSAAGLDAASATLDAICVLSTALTHAQVERYLRSDSFALVRPRASLAAFVAASAGPGVAPAASYLARKRRVG